MVMKLVDSVTLEPDCAYYGYKKGEIKNNDVLRYNIIAAENTINPNNFTIRDKDNKLILLPNRSIVGDESGKVIGGAPYAKK